MNDAHIHLIINHLPIMGAMLALPLLVLTLWRRERAMLDASVVLLVISAIGGVVAWDTGGDAEEVVEDLPGITKQSIEEHEENADVAAVLMGIAGAVGVGALFVSRRKDGPVPLLAAAAPLVATVIAGVALGLTGQSGGRIHHPEANDAAFSAGSPGGGEVGEENEAEEPSGR